MKNYCNLLITLSLLIVMAGQKASASPSLEQYDLVFYDEFDSGSLDPQKWTTAPIWGSHTVTNAEEQFYIDSFGLNVEHPYSPFSFTADTLKITAVPAEAGLAAPDQPPETSPVWDSFPDYQYATDYDPEEREYLSGIITSLNSYNFTHGYVEMRARVPSGQGLWSAFWLLTSKYVEDVPEIDIMEYLGQFPDEVNHTLHYFDTSDDWNLVSSPTYKTTGPDYSQNFHTYGLAWHPDAIVWYVDGVEVKRVTDEDFLIAKQSMYIIANLAVGGTWPGSPDASTPFPAEFEIDYIRAYKKKVPSLITPQVLADRYTQVFSDEFNGTQLDPLKWNTSFLWGPYLRINQEEQLYLDKLGRHDSLALNPFEVNEGTLKISAEETLPVDLPNQPSLTDPEWQLYPTHQHNPDYLESWTPGYTSGLITSYDALKFVNGYVEIRAKLPEGGGLWPAFWLLNGYYVGPMPEIDIVELQGGNPDTIHQSYHYHNSFGELVSTAETTVKSNGSYSDGFHTYGLEWHPGQINWYIDGEITRTLTSPDVSTQLMYIIVNLAVGGNFVGPINTEFPNTFEIDYVRAWQLRETDNCSSTDWNSGNGRIGNRTWVDENGNGELDTGESGAPNIMIDLLNSCGDVLDTTTSSNGGWYQFRGLSEGNYQLKFYAPSGFEFTDNTSPTRWKNSDANPATGLSGPVILTAGTVDSTIDAGVVIDSTSCSGALGGNAKIGNRAWLDEDGDGLFDKSETGVANVAIELLDSCGTTLATRTSKPGGWYQFANLEPGAYRLRFTPLTGFLSTVQHTAALWNDSDPDATTGTTDIVSLIENENKSTIDAGFILDTTFCSGALGGSARIGNRTWLDANANGEFDSDESGAANITIDLLDSCGEVLNTTTSSGGGWYQFSGLSEGTYSLRFYPPSGFDITDRTSTVLWKNSDADPVTGLSGPIILGAGSVDSTIDVGVVIDSTSCSGALGGNASIGNRVWLDDDGDGLFDSTEQGLAGVVIELQDSCGNPLMTRTSNPDGWYHLANLASGTYRLSFSPPEGYLPTSQHAAASWNDSNPDPVTGLTDYISIGAEDNNSTVDGGFILAP